MTRETGRAAARTMHLSLKAGERVFINGAVVREIGRASCRERV